jgi:SAM-dependent methyltransferase
MESDLEEVRALEYAGWQRAAAHYGNSFAGATTCFIGKLLDAAGVGAGTRVLDVACGPGYAAAAAAARGANVTGLDFAPAMVAIARAAYPEFVFEQGDAEALPYDDATFDAVVSNFGIHHAPRPLLALTQVHRVLSWGGAAAFTSWAEPSENLAWRFVLDAIERHADMGVAKALPPGGRLRTAEDWSRAMETAGFSRVRVELRRNTWPLASAEDFVECMQRGTARMAALINAQNPSALPAIKADIAARVERYREGDQIFVPVAALLASGSKTERPNRR